MIAFALPSSPKSGLDIAAVPSDDATDWDIRYGAQWPVCRSWCQCHPLPTVLFLWLGVCNLDPGVPGKSPRYPPSAILSLRYQLLRCYHSQSDIVTFARIAAISSPLMNAVADREIRKPRTTVSASEEFRLEFPGNRVRRDLDSPAAATATL